MNVFVTGMGVMSSLGNSVSEMFSGLIENKTNVKYYPEWENHAGLNSFLGAPVPEFDEKVIPRKHRRSMSKMSEMSTLASLQALTQANFPVEELNQQKSRVAIILGSTAGSPVALEQFYKKLFAKGGPEGQLATSFFKTMNHSVAANVACALNFLGPVIPIASACSTSAQAIILGTELIKSKQYDLVIAGGADELHYTVSCVFDIVHAASRGFTETPNLASRPFDKDRTGLVISEGASSVIIESEEHMLKRGSNPLAKISSGDYLCDGSHMTQPQPKTMARVMKNALEKANLKSSDIDYVNAHATSTVIGDIDESSAISEVFGEQTPVASLKGHLGHSLAACGGIEVIASVEMIAGNTLIPTRNLEAVDSRCSNINLIKQPLYCNISNILSNNFAFGGMNTSIIISKA